MSTSKWLAIGAACALAVSARGASLNASQSVRDYAFSLGADSESDELFKRRVTLELRRAGGARREKVGELLTGGARQAFRSWGWVAMQACENSEVDCSSLPGLAGKWLDGLSPEARRRGEDVVVRIEQEARLQAMSEVERRALYLRVIERGYVHEGAIALDRWNTSIRALRERMLDLVPAIERSNAAWPDRGVERQLVVARALQAKDPTAELLALVARGAQEESENLNRAGASPPVATRTEAVRAAVLALRELRRRNPEGLAEDLKHLVAAYEPVRKRIGDELAQTGRPTSRDADGQARVRGEDYLGDLGWSIVETVGDAGDRAFERERLGACLWDQVGRAEESLLKSRKLTSQSMVTR